MTRDLDFLAEHWPHLLEERLRGTARPWREPTMSAAARQAADQRALEERRDRNEDAPGETRAPMHVDVVDVIIGLVAMADDVAERLCQDAGVERLPYASSAYADPRPYLRKIRELLPTADAQLRRYAEDEITRHAIIVADALDIARDGQVLRMLCPWCQGRRDGKTGQRTFITHEVAGGGWLIVCHGDNCSPASADCGTWWRGRPAWTPNEWSWLDKRTGHVA